MCIVEKKFPENKFLSDEMATMALHLGYGQKKILLGNVTVEQLCYRWDQI